MKTSLMILSAMILAACSGHSIKENINKAGDVAGQTAGEFIEGASKGVEKAFDVNVSLPASLRDKGLEFGKATVSSDSLGTDNMLVLYVILNKNFDGKLTAKVFDDKDLEMGRTTIPLSGPAGGAEFVEFHFDKRTNIDSKNKIVVE